MRERRHKYLISMREKPITHHECKRLHLYPVEEGGEEEEGRPETKEEPARGRNRRHNRRYLSMHEDNMPQMMSMQGKSGAHQFVLTDTDST